MEVDRRLKTLSGQPLLGTALNEEGPGPGGHRVPAGVHRPRVAAQPAEGQHAAVAQEQLQPAVYTEEVRVLVTVLLSPVQ
jgi:hypothetical protein